MHNNIHKFITIQVHIYIYLYEHTKIKWTKYKAIYTLITVTNAHIQTYTDTKKVTQSQTNIGAQIHSVKSKDTNAKTQTQHTDIKIHTYTNRHRYTNMYTHKSTNTDIHICRKG